MPIVSAVLYTRPEVCEQVMASLRDDPRLTLADSHGDRFAVVADTHSRREDKELWRSIERRGDVLRVELVIAQFADLHGREAQ